MTMDEICYGPYIDEEVIISQIAKNPECLCGMYCSREMHGIGNERIAGIVDYVLNVNGSEIHVSKDTYDEALYLISAPKTDGGDFTWSEE